MVHISSLVMKLVRTLRFRLAEGIVKGFFNLRLLYVFLFAKLFQYSHSLCLCFDAILIKSLNCFQIIDQSFGKLDYHVYMVIVLVPMLLLVSIRVIAYSF